MKIGFIGLGNMGNSIARDLITPENSLTVYDVRHEVMDEFARLGAKTAASPAEVAESADVVGICVRSDQEVLDVLNAANGILSRARSGTIIAIHSTIHLSTLDQIRNAATAKRVRIVDAPVSRGTNAPKTQAISFMLGGDPEDVMKVRAYCTPAALQVLEVGKAGSAMALKISNNVITYLTLVALRDAVRLAEAAGVDLRCLSKLATANGVAGPNMQYALNRRAGAATRPHHVVDTAEANAQLGEKDLECALDAAAHLGVKLPAVELARQEVRATMFEMLK